MNKEAVLAIDYGTQSVKCLAFDLEGHLLSMESENYPWIYGDNGKLELDPRVAFANAETCVARTSAKLSDYSFKAISFSYFGHGMLLVDENYEPLTNIILLADQRGDEVYSELAEKGVEKIFKETNNMPMFSGTFPFKLYWYKKNQPVIFNKIYRLSDIQKYTLHRLGVEAVNDGSMAYCSCLFDYRSHVLSKEMLDAFEIPESIIDRKMVSADYNCGTIRRFGSVDLHSEVIVMPGLHDTECGVLGMGAIPENPGVLSNSMGTYQQCGFLFTGDEKTREERGKPFLTTKIGSYFSEMNATSSGGSAMSWFIRTFCDGDPIYEDLFERCSFDAGQRVLFANTFSSSKAKIANINLNTTKYDIFEALIEGITLTMAKGYESINRTMIKEFGCPIKEMRVMGGCSRADRYLQLMADVYNFEIVRSDHIQGTGAGAAMIAAVGAGIFKDYKDASDRMVHLTDRFYPNAENHKRYMKKLEEYLAYKNASIH